MTDTDVRSSQQPSAFFRPRRTRVPGGPVVWLLLITVVVVGLLSAWGENGLSEYLHLKNQRDGMQVRHEALELETARLEARLDDLRTDPEALETLARERYNMRREGEQVIRLVPAEDTPKQP